MRLHEVYLLLEYQREVTLSKWGDKVIAAVRMNHNLLHDNWIDTRLEDYAGTEDVPGKTLFDKDWPYPWKQEFLNDFLEKLESIDPTANNQYVQTLVRWYVGNIDKSKQLQANYDRIMDVFGVSDELVKPDNWWELEDSGAVEDFDADFDNFRVDAQNLNTFQLEDAEQITDTLRNFERIKPQIPPQQRDIGSYPTYYQFEDYVDEIAGGSEQTEISDEVLKRNDVTVLYNGPLGTVTIPKTHDASCILGRGTKWCTATSNNDEWFEHYNESNDLIIYKEKPGGAKYQFHVSIHTIEARDARDRSLPYSQLVQFTKEHPVMSKILKDSRLKAVEYLAKTSWNKSPDGALGVTDTQETAIFNELLDYNKKRGGGVMPFLDGYYTSKQSTYSLANAKNLPIQKYAKRLVKYALQRKKPWPQMEKLIIDLLQKTLPKINFSNNTHLKKIENFTKIMDIYADALNPQWKEYNDIKTQLVAGIKNATT